VVQYLSKKVNPAQTAWLNGERIGGIPRVRSFQLKGLSKCKRTVSRAYGGQLTGSGLKDK
jgi:ribosomal protein L34E